MALQLVIAMLAEGAEREAATVANEKVHRHSVRVRPAAPKIFATSTGAITN